MAGHILRDILIIFAFAVPVVLVAHRIRIPSIVGFLIAGLMIGPHALRFIPNIEDIRVLAEVGVALLLFSIGLEFSLARIRGWDPRIFGMGIVQIVATALIGFAVGIDLGIGTRGSIFIGCAAALSSTAIVLAVLSQKRMFDAPAGRIATGILILQDLAVIPMMVLLKFVSLPFSQGIARYHMVPGIAGEVVIATIKLAVLIAAFIVMSRWVLKPFLHHISKPLSKELFVVVVIGIAIGGAYATESLGLSFALGAFLAGILVSTTDYRFQALSEIAPFRYCFNGLFFVSVGMLVDPHFIVQNPLPVAILVALFIVAKIFAVGGSILAFGYPIGIAAIGGFMLAQTGEFSFLLIHFGWQTGALDRDVYQLVVSSAAITMIVAPLLIAVAPAIGERLSSITWQIKLLRGREERRSPDEEERLDDHAIICGFGPLGMAVGKILDDQGMKYVVLEMNPSTVLREKRGGRRIYLGDGASLALLNHSGIERARLMAIAIPDYLNSIAIIERAKRLNPNIYVIVRSKYRDQCQALYDAGADIVVCEELEAGIEMGRYILLELGIDEDETKGILGKIRSFGSADFF